MINYGTIQIWVLIRRGVGGRKEEDEEIDRVRVES